MNRHLVCAALAALTLHPFTPAQPASPELAMASPEAISAGAPASPEAVPAAAVSPETAVPVSAEVLPVAASAATGEVGIAEPVFDLNQVNFRLMRVVSDDQYMASPEAYEVLTAPSESGEPIRVAVERDPLLRVTQIERAVIRQDAYGLYSLDLHFTPAETEALAAITASQIGRRLVWASRSNILADFTVRRRDASGRLSLFYGNTPVERLENVVQILQVPYTREVAEDLFVPENEADQIMLRAMQAFEMGRREEAMAHMREALNVGGEGYARRPRGLLVLGELYLQQGNVDIARQCFLEIRRLHQDFPDYILAIQGLRDVAIRVQEIRDVLTLNQEIIQHAGDNPLWADAALEAQSQIVQIEWSEAPESPEARRDAQRLINMLQTRLAETDPAEQFAYIRDLSTIQLHMGQRDDALRAIRSHFAHLPEDPAAAITQVTLLVSGVLQAGHLDDGLALLQEFSEQFRSANDVSTEAIAPVWAQLQEAITQLTTAIEASREGRAPAEFTPPPSMP